MSISQRVPIIFYKLYKVTYLRLKTIFELVSISYQPGNVSKLINQIFKNADWGIRENYRGLPSDSPQREEREG
ncbi:MAG: hypothetical protein JJE45_06595 [Prolixibacteraceae bacterium]|nr:hypothetical protein [Prolixibacteraceae bacterium]